MRLKPIGVFAAGSGGSPLVELVKDLIGSGHPTASQQVPTKEPVVKLRLGGNFVSWVTCTILQEP
jgi:hypothetical protein